MGRQSGVRRDVVWSVTMIGSGVDSSRWADGLRCGTFVDALSPAPRHGLLAGAVWH